MAGKSSSIATLLALSEEPHQDIWGLNCPSESSTISDGAQAMSVQDSTRNITPVTHCGCECE